MKDIDFFHSLNHEKLWFFSEQTGSGWNTLATVWILVKLLFIVQELLAVSCDTSRLFVLLQTWRVSRLLGSLLTNSRENPAATAASHSAGCLQFFFKPSYSDSLEVPVGRHRVTMFRSWEEMSTELSLNCPDFNVSGDAAEIRTVAV